MDMDSSSSPEGPKRTAYIKTQDMKTTDEFSAGLSGAPRSRIKGLCGPVFCAA